MMRCRATGMSTPLKRERDEGGDEQVRRVLQIRLPGNRERQHAGLQGEHVEQREHAVLIEQQEAHQHHGAREQMRDVGIEGSSSTAASTTNSRIAPSRPSIRATPRNSGTRNTRIFAIAVSEAPARSAGDRA